VCVEGSRFEPAEQYTVKLEGSARAGYETISLVGMRDLATWTSTLETVLTDRVRSLLGLARADYEVQVRCYGDDAILGSLEPDRTPPREVGVLLKVCAASQAVATSIAKIANPVLLHLPLPGMDHLPSFAFATSPAETERGAVYEFVLNHAVDVDTPHELFRTKHNEVTYGGQL
jgi:hypothetical protein